MTMPDQEFETMVKAFRPQLEILFHLTQSTGHAPSYVMDYIVSLAIQGLRYDPKRAGEALKAIIDKMIELKD